MSSWGVSLAVGGGLALLGLAVWDIGRGADGRRPPTAPSMPSHDETALAQAPSVRVRATEESAERTESAAAAALRADASPTDGEAAGEREAENAGDEAPAGTSTRELVAPVIRAIRGDYANAQARKEAMLDGLRRSGPTSEGWAASGRSVFQSWAESVAKVVPVSVRNESIACYQAGCEATVSFDSPEAAEQAAAAFRAIQEPGAPHGGRVQTPAVEENGALTASWILLRPEG